MLHRPTVPTATLVPVTALVPIVVALVVEVINMAFETGITLTVYADRDYFYEVDIAEELSLTYKEIDRKDDIRLDFGSLDEMEAVAKAMLKAVKLAKEN